MSDWNMCKHKEFCNKEMSASDKGKVEELRASRLFDEKEIVSEPEGKGEDAEEESEQQEHFKENNPGQNAASGALVPLGDEAEEDTNVQVDEAFLKFQMRIQLYPEQVLRYDRVEYDMPDTEPLWVQENYKPESIPECERCHGPRTYEFQILSTILNYLGVNHIASDSLDWGSLFIYTCKKNCDVGNDIFSEEILWKQDFSADGVEIKPGDAQLLKKMTR
jgi:pre-rRNA-processing protein TSR4